MEVMHKQNPQALFLSLSNMNIFGLGYWLAGEKKRWRFSLIGSLLLLVAAHLLNASRNPLLWAGIFFLAFFGMAVDLWLILKKKPELINEKLTRKTYLLPLIAFLVNLVFYGGFFAFRAAGNNLISRGDEAYSANDFDNSFNDYSSASRFFRLSLNPAVVLIDNRLNEVSAILAGRDFFAKGDYPAVIDAITGFNKNFPDSIKVNEMMMLGLDSSLAWAEDLRGKKEYESSFQKLDNALNIYVKANPSRITEINNALASNYLLWGENLVEQKDYETGIEKLEIVINQYNQSDAFDQAYEAAARAHYDAAGTLIQANKEYELAASHLNMVIDIYLKSTFVDKAILMKPAALLGWGKLLNDDEAYLKALEKYDEIKALTEDPEVLADVDAEIQKTIQLLARNIGGDGEVDIMYTLQETCAGFPATRPTIDIFPEEPGKAMVCDGSDYLVPAEVLADAPGTFRYVILREDGSRRVQACPYSGGHTLERWVNTSLITVQSVKDAKIFSKKTFTGAPPSPCPNEYAFSADTDLTWGDWVNPQDITDWLEKVLK